MIMQLTQKLRSYTLIAAVTGLCAHCIRASLLLLVFCGLFIFTGRVIGQEFDNGSARNGICQSRAIVEAPLNNHTDDFSIYGVYGTAARSRPSVFVNDKLDRPQFNIGTSVSSNYPLRADRLDGTQRESGEGNWCSIFMDRSVECSCHRLYFNGIIRCQIFRQITSSDVKRIPDY